MCMDNFKLFTDFIRIEDKAPVSLDTTTLILQKRKQIEEESFKAKRYSQLLVKKQSEITDAIIKAKMNAEQINSSKGYSKVEVRSGYKQIETTENVTQCINCPAAEGICHVNCRWSNGEDKAKCFAMDPKTGNCRVCRQNCHWSDHQNVKFYFEPCKIEHEIVLNPDLEAQYGEGVLQLDNISFLLLEYIDELIETINELEKTHKKIQDCDAFMQLHAARKKVYIATNYFQD